MAQNHEDSRISKEFLESAWFVGFSGKSLWYWPLEYLRISMKFQGDS